MVFLNEFPQLPPIKQFPTFLELGRSKGVAVVIGAQDTAQIRAVYGQDQAKSWFGMAGTRSLPASTPVKRPKTSPPDRGAAGRAAHAEYDPR
jgi:type IV secretory pathway TraG/TraD family ATPase VirD4